MIDQETIQKIIDLDLDLETVIFQGDPEISDHVRGRLLDAFFEITEELRGENNISEVLDFLYNDLTLLNANDEEDY